MGKAQPNTLVVVTGHGALPVPRRAQHLSSDKQSWHAQFMKDAACRSIKNAPQLTRGSQTRDTMSWYGGWAWSMTVIRCFRVNGHSRASSYSPCQPTKQQSGANIKRSSDCQFYIILYLCQANMDVDILPILPGVHSQVHHVAVSEDVEAGWTERTTLTPALQFVLHVTDLSSENIPYELWTWLV